VCVLVAGSIDCEDSEQEKRAVLDRKKYRGAAHGWC
jgi:hypothetical protein